jgi:cell division septation protein DedD
MDLPPLPDVTGQAPAPVAPKAPAAPGAPAAPAATAPTPGVQQGMYYVQFGMFGNAKNAERMAKNMRAEGLRVTIIKATVKGKVMSYVLLDETFPTRDAATKRAMQIKKQIKQDTAVYHAK